MIEIIFKSLEEAEVGPTPTLQASIPLSNPPFPSIQLSLKTPLVQNFRRGEKSSWIRSHLPLHPCHKPPLARSRRQRRTITANHQIESLDSCVVELLSGCFCGAASEQSVDVMT